MTTTGLQNSETFFITLRRRRCSAGRGERGGVCLAYLLFAKTRGERGCGVPCADELEADGDDDDCDEHHHDAVSHTVRVCVSRFQLSCKIRENQLNIPEPLCLTTKHLTAHMFKNLCRTSCVVFLKRRNDLSPTFSSYASSSAASSIDFRLSRIL